MYKLEELNNSKVSELRDIAKKLNIPKYEKLKKIDLSYAILDYQAEHTDQTKNNETPKKENEKKVVIKKEEIKKNVNVHKKDFRKDSKQSPNPNNKNNNFKDKNHQKTHPNSKPKSDYDYDFSGLLKLKV